VESVEPALFVLGEQEAVGVEGRQCGGHFEIGHVQGFGDECDFATWVVGDNAVDGYGAMGH